MNLRKRILLASGALLAIHMMHVIAEETTASSDGGINLNTAGCGIQLAAPKHLCRNVDDDQPGPHDDHEKWDIDHDPSEGENDLRMLTITGRAGLNGGNMTLEIPDEAEAGHVRFWKDPGKEEPAYQFSWEVAPLSFRQEYLYVEGYDVGKVRFKAKMNCYPSEVKTATATTNVHQIDLDLDSLDDNGYDADGYDDSEDRIEASEKEENGVKKPGKVVVSGINTDTDGDGTPDFAELTIPGGKFVPVQVTLKEPFDPEKADVRFDYKESKPEESSEGWTVSGAGTAEEQEIYTLHTGGMRLWKKDAPSRSADDYVAPDEDHPWTEIADGSSRTKILYLEYVDKETPEAAGRQTIKITATEDDAECEDEVVATLLLVEVIIPKLDSGGNQIDGEFVGATELKVAKWEDAFEGIGANGSVKDDFIGWDKDRFFVRIPGGASMGIEAVEVATDDCPDASYNDDATRIELTASGPDSISDSMILVSDDEDDDYAGSGAGADDQDVDRTHKVQLGGNLVIKSVFINGTGHDVNMKVPVPVRKVLPVDFIRMNVAGVRPIAEIEEAGRIVNERYAQVGLRVDASIKELPWPYIPNANPGNLDLFDEPPGEQIGPLTDEYKSFIDQTDPPGTNVYFLIHTQANGVAITLDQLRFEPDGEISGNYFDKAFVNSISAAPGYTSAHELAHLLAYRTDSVNDHAEPFWNLLSVGNPIQDPPVKWSKRLSGVQQVRINQHHGIQNP